MGGFRGGFSGHERNKLFVNPGGGDAFFQLAEVAGLADDADGRAVAPFDMDGDGRMDLAVQSLGGLSVYWNQIPDPGHFIQLVLQPAPGTQSAVHAEVRITAQGRTTIDRVRLTAGFHTQVLPRIHVGVGQAQTVDRLVIRWPNGVEQTLTDLKVDQRYLITEGSGVVTLLSRPQWPETQRPPDIVPPTLDLTVKNTRGDSVPLALPGRPTIVNLWAPWCVPCADEVQHLQRFSEDNQGWLQVVGVSVESEKHQDNAQFIKTHGLTYPNHLATQAFIDSIFGGGNEIPLPTTLLFDASGTLVRRYSRPLKAEDLVAMTAPFRIQAAAEDWMWSSEFSRTDGDPLGAVDALKKAVALSPRSVPLHLELAMTAAQQPTLAKTALETAQGALSLDSENPVVWEIYGVISERYEKPDIALSVLERAPELPGVYALRARLFQRLNRTQDAVQALQKAVALMPDNSEYQEQLNRLLRTRR